MPKWELAIACRDEVGSHRKKEGDIVAFKPHPWGDWGKKGELNHLIIVADGLEQEDLEAMSQYHRDDGLTMGEIKGMADTFFKASKGTIFEGQPYFVHESKIVSKKRYGIRLDRIKRWYKGLDLDRVRDVTDRYQPFLANPKKYTSGSIVIDFNEKVAICHDKHTGKTKYLKEKE